MNDGEHLLAAIIANPADDAVRLIFADWLEEQGHGERAEFIRLGFELETALKGCQHTGYMSVNRCGECEFCTIWDRLRITFPFVNWIERSGPLVHRFHGVYYGAEPNGVPILYFRKGFPEIVHCPLDVWLKPVEGYPSLGACIVSKCPIRKVVASDKRPSHFPLITHGDQWEAKPGWEAASALASGMNPTSRIPDALFRLLDGEKTFRVSANSAMYNTDQAATDALSDVLLRVAHDPGLLEPVRELKQVAIPRYSSV